MIDSPRTVEIRNKTFALALTNLYIVESASHHVCLKSDQI